MVVTGGLTLCTLVIWFFNYRTIQQAVTTMESAAQEQSVNLRHYIKEYQETKGFLDTANKKVAELTIKLEAANAELAISRSQLASLQAMNEEMNWTVQSFEHYKEKAKAKGESLEAMINAFKVKNKRLQGDLETARKDLSVFLPGIPSSLDTKTKILAYRKHIRVVKKNIHMLEKEALAMKRAAQQQHDRLESLYGNNGYMIKDGRDLSIKREDPKVDIKVEFK